MHAPDRRSESTASAARLAGGVAIRAHREDAPAAIRALREERWEVQRRADGVLIVRFPGAVEESVAIERVAGVLADRPSLRLEGAPPPRFAVGPLRSGADAAPAFWVRVG
ncbi:MAG TPA: hypothetical protein VFA05_05690 [Gaiellaceae bacterium]|nr:hypothetical protein [Gaiellaceae bacterium]